MRAWMMAMGLVCVVPGPLFAQAKVGPAEGYAGVAKSLDAFIREQVEDKRLPALSIALVDDQRIVWAEGYGHADTKTKRPATAETAYRVGSVSKLFTDIAVMRLVEKGLLDLDAPVARYLPDFRPKNPFARPITLRHLMAHRSGLVREPPVGSYFDPKEPTLEATILSLNATTLLHEPGTKTKYSNAGVSVVGRVLEVTRKEPFAAYLRRDLLAPLGMGASNFAPTASTRDRLAKAVMWTYHGKEFPAPTFELGSAPAGCMVSTVLDLGRFAAVLFAGGKAGEKVILDKKTLESMWEPQFVPAGTKDGFGLGFAVSSWKGRRRVGHNGAIYGFATDLSALPDDKLAVVVIASCDCANAVGTRIADLALEHLLAVKAKAPMSAIERTKPVTAEMLAKAGRYASGAKAFDLRASAGKLYYHPTKGGFRVELRLAGKALVADDRLGQGMQLEPTEKGFVLGKDEYVRTPVKKPEPIPATWRGLIGEYGWDHNILYILEKDGKLYALIEWFFEYPLERESDDVYLFPKDFGLYPGEKLRFRRDEKGRAVAVEAAGVKFVRRTLDGEDGSTFRIKPIRPLDELRKEAQKAKPPEERGTLFRKNELVELVRLDPTIKLDVRYATADNFLGTPFYASPKAFLQKPAGEAMARVHARLAKQGYGLMVHDGYRPWSVTKMFWEATPDNLRVFVADPQQGSRHNRGCAVDLTLYDRATGKPVEMVGGYDEMSDRSYPDYPGGTSLQRWHRDSLRREMESEGFAVYEAEWWHFDYKDWRKYPIGNVTFEEIGGK